ncbi:MAG TPA: PBP1A family penicillin-binding protein, partial [Miltoncostaeaceae bacterium]|nr:PBP1A family penicillin-binding protein [Miltoncostaeaceae bacterium]
MSDLRRRRLRKARQSRQRKTQRNLIIALSAVAAVGAAVLVSALAVNSVGESLRDGELKEIRLGQNTRIYDKNGKELGIIAGVTNRTVVPGGKIPKVLKDATVAIEDKRFYEHHGVDYYRLLGAGLRDLESGSATQGGSTITMQLVKNLYSPRADRTLSKKLEEAYLAFQYEKKYTKNQILARYLNGVFYGQNAVGVEAASLTYFDEDVWEVTLPQAALLAGLPQAPTAYNPFENPDEARARRNVVLDEMATQGFITQERADQAKRAGLALKRGQAYKRKREEYFFEYVRQVLIDRYGEKQVENGGFKVYTTIDPALQSAARRSIRENLYYDDDPDAAIVMVDSQKGFIRAMASSQRFSAENQFNLATQALRQPGSTFKTFVLTEAIRQGINPYTTLYDSRPLNFVDDHYGPIDVKTYSNSYRGAIPIAQATLSSDNTVFEQLTLDVKPPNVIKTAYDMGVPRARKLPDVASVGLGSGTVTPLDMATAYAPLSNGGFRIAPLAIRKIVKPDGTVDAFAPERDEVFSDGVAHEVTRILEDNVTGGTGTGAQIGVPVAGKTGTTDDYVDAWFVGYTPRYSTAVWVGYPNSDGVRRSMYSVHGITVAGGTFPASIWSDFMSTVVDRDGGSPDFPLPNDPVTWSPFTSEFIRAAGEAQRQEEAAAAAAARAAKKSTPSDTTTTPSTAPNAPSPPGAPTPTPVPSPAPTPAPTPQPAPA